MWLSSHNKGSDTKLLSIWSKWRLQSHKRRPKLISTWRQLPLADQYVEFKDENKSVLDLFVVQLDPTQIRSKDQYLNQNLDKGLNQNLDRLE